MRLYATVTSERATKGQGGNEFLDIHVLGADAESMLLIKLKPSKEPNGVLELVSIGGAQGLLDAIRESLTPDEKKGKKKKGEWCNECMSRTCGQH